ncbi:hypothetical protein A6I77_01285 [Achromobacter xylosoxidans]|nr:hypothetical protein A6I77_01285 [Achromobacter xylosoxidans]
MPSRLFRAAILPAAVLAASAHANTPPHGIEVCTLTGTSGQYSVRVRNTGSAPLARADVTGVRLDGGGQPQGNISVSLTAIPPGRYETAILARHGESAALVSIATYQSVNGLETRQQELFAGKVAHVSPGSALQYTLAPLAVRGWTVAYGGPNAPTLAPGSAVLLVYPASSGKKMDTRPEAGRTPADVVPLAPCPVPRGR